MLLSRSIRTLLLSVLLYTQASYQFRNLGAKAEIQLDHGMSIITYFLQQTAEDVIYQIWFNNPTNFPYWENSLCLAVVAGTPALKDPSNERCSFLPVFDEVGNKNPYETSGEDCIQEQISINPCRDRIQLNAKADCGAKLNILPQYYLLDETRYAGLTLLTTKKYRKTWLNPDHSDSIYRQSMLVAYTDRNNSMAEWGQLLKCQDINLGYGPVNDFTFYPIKSDHTYDTSKFLSNTAALVQVNMFIIMGAAVFAFIKCFVH